MSIRRNNLVSLCVGLLLFTSVSAFAGGTQTWKQSDFEDLAKGTTDGVAICSEGGLELAPAFKAVTTTPSAYIWAIAGDRHGNLYAATGTPARVYKITPEGKSSVIFQSQELQVQALAMDGDALYAATNPDGKVYRLTSPEQLTTARNKHSVENDSRNDSGWNSSVYYQPGSKYIWDLALDKSGNLYVATGDQGEIFRVTPSGDHSLFFKSDEAHIRVLAFDAQGNIIAGSDGSGLVYRISPDGQGFVLYSAPKKEITALAVDRRGNIYAAGIGEKRTSPSVTPGVSIFPSGSSLNTAANNGQGQAGPAMNNGIPANSAGAGNFIGNPGSNSSEGSDIYRIAADGVPSRIWSSHDDLVYALAFDQNGKLLAGTGNRGHIFQIEGGDQFTDLLKASASQVTAFAGGSGDRLYASTSNLGKIYILSPDSPSEGTYQSDVFDAHIFSRWGRMEVRGRGNVELFARSGNVDNPDRNWTSWKKVDWQKDAEIDVAPARFIQWKAVLHAGHPAPRIDSVTVNYLSKNVAPEFDEITVQEGVRYQPGSKSPEMGVMAPRNISDQYDGPPPSTRDRTSIGVTWGVHDENGDDMVYAIYYRGENDSRWLLLKDNLSDKFYSFDSSLLPDGAYVIKVTASDAPSHSPGEALTAEKETQRFEIDTTPPRMEDLKAAREKSEIHVTFRAVDGFSPIVRAEYSIDAGDWQFAAPIGQISDSRNEGYDLHIPDLHIPVPNGADPAGKTPSLDPLEHVVVVRAYDRHGNMGTAKVTIGAR